MRRAKQRCLADGVDGELDFGENRSIRGQVHFSTEPVRQMTLIAENWTSPLFQSYPARTRTWNEGIKIPSVTITPPGKGKLLAISC